MTLVLDWQNATERPDAIGRAVEALSRGQLVAFPTETVYGVVASALVPEAVEKLRLGKGRPEDKPLALAFPNAARAFEWVADMSSMGRRLSRRCWPGPMTLVVASGITQSLSSPLPESVRQRVCPAGTLGLRVPDHDAILEVLERLPGPLVLTSANRSGEPAATTATEVVHALPSELALVIDDGPTHYQQASTVVKVNGNQWQVLRAGVVSAAQLQESASCVIVFVCTGNTCRSPLAEALCKKMLADRLGCPPGDLPARGFHVLSAGLAAMMGASAAALAIQVAQEFGADLSAHLSRPLSAALAAGADYLVGMTASHVQSLAAYCPQLAGPPRLLAPDGEEIPDPIGCDRQMYQECAEQIMRGLEKLIPEIMQG